MIFVRSVVIRGFRSVVKIMKGCVAPLWREKFNLYAPNLKEARTLSAIGAILNPYTAIAPPVALERLAKMSGDKEKWLNSADALSVSYRQSILAVFRREKDSGTLSFQFRSFNNERALQSVALVAKCYDADGNQLTSLPNFMFSPSIGHFIYLDAHAFQTSISIEFNFPAEAEFVCLRLVPWHLQEGLTVSGGVRFIYENSELLQIATKDLAGMLACPPPSAIQKVSLLKESQKLDGTRVVFRTTGSGGEIPWIYSVLKTGENERLFLRCGFELLGEAGSSKAAMLTAEYYDKNGLRLKEMSDFRQSPTFGNYLYLWAEPGSNTYEGGFTTPAGTEFTIVKLRPWGHHQIVWKEPDFELKRWSEFEIERWQSLYEGVALGANESGVRLLTRSGQRHTIRRPEQMKWGGYLREKIVCVEFEIAEMDENSALRGAGRDFFGSDASSIYPFLRKAAELQLPCVLKGSRQFLATVPKDLSVLLDVTLVENEES